MLTINNLQKFKTILKFEFFIFKMSKDYIVTLISLHHSNTNRNDIIMAKSKFEAFMIYVKKRKQDILNDAQIYFNIEKILEAYYGFSSEYWYIFIDIFVVSVLEYSGNQIINLFKDEKWISLVIQKLKNLKSFIIKFKEDDIKFMYFIYKYELTYLNISNRKEYYLITSIAIKRIYKKIKNNSYWHIIRLLFY